MELKAYEGNLDIDKLAAPEYRYFDRISRLYRKYRFEGMPKSFAERMKNVAYTEYVNDKAELNRCRHVYQEYQKNIKLVEELKVKINNAKDILEKLIPALEAIGLLTGDDVFAKVNIAKVTGHGERV